MTSSWRTASRCVGNGNCIEVTTGNWRKASYSGGSNCIEITTTEGHTMNDQYQNVTWRKSTKSGSAGHCVELGQHGADVLIRDSKDKGQGPILRYTRAEWTAFLAGAKDGEFDDI